MLPIEKQSNYTLNLIKRFHYLRQTELDSEIKATQNLMTAILSHVNYSYLQLLKI